ncbi:phosphomannomutase, partial [Phenoliferia sp. Uapishka_3]
MSKVIPFADRPQGKTLCLFDVDGTLSPARRVSPSVLEAVPSSPRPLTPSHLQSASQEMLDLLALVRTKAVIGFVGGSDLPKITEQLAIHGQDITGDFDYCFAENGLTAIKLGKVLSSQSFIGFLGEEKYKQLVKFILHYIADMDIPIKRGTFMEFRNGMVNVSPIGRNASITERNEFEAYDKIHKVRATLVDALKAKFADFGLTYSIGGQISFDVFR